jgi:hypothetical protein
MVPFCFGKFLHLAIAASLYHTCIKQIHHCASWLVLWDPVGSATRSGGGPRYVAGLISFTYHKTVPDATGDCTAEYPGTPTHAGQGCGQCWGGQRDGLLTLGWGEAVQWCLGEGIKIGGAP